MSKIRQLAVEESGQTLVEYGLLVALMGLALLVVFTLLARKFDAVLHTPQNGSGVSTAPNASRS
jgi:Flp pilus assembly pilin Flp